MSGFLSFLGWVAGLGTTALLVLIFIANSMSDNPYAQVRFWPYAVAGYAITAGLFLLARWVR